MHDNHQSFDPEVLDVQHTGVSLFSIGGLQMRHETSHRKNGINKLTQAGRLNNKADDNRESLILMLESVSLKIV